MNPTNDYKALVCILQAGGNDSFNMLLPTGNSAYSEYATTRSNQALAKNSILNLTHTNSGLPSLGVHPSMPEVQQLYNSGRLGFLSNIGTLVQPTSKSQFENGSVSLPLGLFSHADQIQQWQTSVPQSRASSGWGGRMSDILQSMNNNQNISMNISLSGRNIFQSGNTTSEYTITFGGWDHHDELLNTQAGMLSVLSKGLDEFNNAVNELGVADNVTTFSISDFARTLTSNGNGTDHAWGGNVMVMGGKVKGGHTYGNYPSLALNNNLDVGNGVLIPELSTDEYFAELAQWFGVSNTDINTIFPNLSNFYTVGSQPPIGFMNV